MLWLGGLESQDGWGSLAKRKLRGGAVPAHDLVMRLLLAHAHLFEEVFGRDECL